MRTLYIRVPDLEELRRAQVEKEGSDTKLVRKLANYQVLILDEWLLTKPEGDFRNFLLEVMERRYKEGSTMFGTQYQRKDWYARLGSDVTAEAIMDRKCEASHLRSNAKPYVMRSPSTRSLLTWAGAPADFA